MSFAITSCRNERRSASLRGVIRASAHQDAREQHEHGDPRENGETCVLEHLKAGGEEHGVVIGKNLRVPDGGKQRTVNDLVVEARSRLRRLEPHEAATALADGWLLVDIRDSGQIAADGEIPGAVRVPRNVLEWRAPPATEFQDPRIRGREDRLILVCSQGYQSSLAAATLQDLGCSGATDVVGGFEAWREAGLPILQTEEG